MNSLTSEGFNTSLGSIRNIIGDVVLLGPCEVTEVDASNINVYHLPEVEVYQGGVYRISFETNNSKSSRAAIYAIYCPQNPSGATYYFEHKMSPDTSTTIYTPTKNIITSADKKNNTAIHNETFRFTIDVLYVRLS